MITITTLATDGFKGAIRGMRNPYDSWSKSDSEFIEGTKLGENDLKLAKSLIKAGSDHRKFLRMIHVQADIKAPLYWLKEMDTYKIGTTSNSCSTMHTIHKKTFMYMDFSHECIEGDTEIEDCLEHIILTLNYMRARYLETKNMKYWYAIIQLLPSSYNQLRTYDLDYETLLRIYFARKNHKLSEWHSFCDWIKSLPYMAEFIGVLEETND